MKDQYEEAIADYTTVVSLAPTEPLTLDCLAWILATAPSDNLRDGRLAYRLATAACEFTAWKEDITVATLAAACAECGNFEEAVWWQKQAIDLLGDAAGKAEYLKQLELYQNRKPYRRPWKDPVSRRRTAGVPPPLIPSKPASASVPAKP